MDKSDIVLSKIKNYPVRNRSIIVAIDGRCASGKSTLAQCICEQTGCNLIHMDDFFLRPHQRTAERMNEPGGNIDYERFLDEVLIPLKKGTDFSYRPYCCRTGDFGAPILIDGNKLTLIEGSYSCHPKFADFYDITFFMDVSACEQLKRIECRNGREALEKFRTLWIPLEEKYFNEFNIKETCEQL